jgi:hypothetical protein
LALALAHVRHAKDEASRRLYHQFTQLLDQLIKLCFHDPGKQKCAAVA